MSTIHLRSAAYVRAHRADYPHAYTIQAAPRLQFGEGLDGSVPLLTPTVDEWRLGQVLVARRRDGLPMDPDAPAAYRGSMEARWGSRLGAECHRRWAAPLLRRSGWSVVLDGIETP